MNNVLTRTLEMLLRVRDYGSQHATSFAADSLAAEQFAVVAEAVEALTEAGRSQTTGLSSVQ
jgi:hypothetical protein